MSIYTSQVQMATEWRWFYQSTDRWRTHSIDSRCRWNVDARSANNCHRIPRLRLRSALSVHCGQFSV